MPIGNGKRTRSDELKLNYIAEHYRELLDDAARKNTSALDILIQLIGGQAAARRDRALARRVRDARLPKYRVIAMMTMEERDRASEVVESLIGTDAFNKAKQCWQNDFADNPIPVVREVGAKSQAGDAATIQQVLSGWFA